MSALASRLVYPEMVEVVMKIAAITVVAVVIASATFAAPPDGIHWETAAIQARIDAAAAKGGGRVTVEKGVQPRRTSLD